MQSILVQSILVQSILVQGILVQGILVQSILVQSILVQGILVQDVASAVRFTSADPLFPCQQRARGSGVAGWTAHPSGRPAISTRLSLRGQWPSSEHGRRSRLTRPPSEGCRKRPPLGGATSGSPAL